MKTEILYFGRLRRGPAALHRLTSVSARPEEVDDVDVAADRRHRLYLLDEVVQLHLGRVRCAGQGHANVT